MLAVNVPVLSYGRSDVEVVDFYKEAIRRVKQLPAVDGVALGMLTPWREGGSSDPACNSPPKARPPHHPEDDPRGQFRIITPGFFSALGVPMIFRPRFQRARSQRQ